jgi:hypothetical protein
MYNIRDQQLLAWLGEDQLTRVLGWQSASGGNRNTSNEKNRYYVLNKLYIIE